MERLFLLLLFTIFNLANSLSINRAHQDQKDEIFNIHIPDGGKLWVVLVAGSSGYFNYRHQADVCHAYQIVHKHGVPDENIIVMMYDDIAYNKENPEKGKIFNRPNGTNVYNGVLKDYTGKEVTNQTFVDVLLGKEINYGSGKTLKSGPNDHVFVFFADHGGVGLIAFPHTLLHATTLVTTLKQMHNQKKYGKMTLYIEACESGSMFKGLLPDNIDIFATTAANATTSSYACYYDDHLHTFLGDVYSVKWMEDSDRENLLKETLEKQYKIVKEETNTSMVSQFGDLSMGKMKVGEFQGEGNINWQLNLLEKDSMSRKLPSWSHKCGRDAVPGPEVPKVILEKKLQQATSEEEKNEIQKELDDLLSGRKSLFSTNFDIITDITGNEELTKKIMATTVELTSSINHACHKRVAETFHDKCYNLGCNGYALRQVNHFATMCELGYKAEDMMASMKKICSGLDTQQPICGIN